MLTEVRDVGLPAECAMVEVFHPVLAECFTLREGLRGGVSRFCYDERVRVNIPQAQRRREQDEASADHSVRYNIVDERTVALTMRTRSRAGLSKTVVVLRIPMGSCVKRVFS